MFEHLKSKIWRKNERIFELKREVQVLRKQLDQIFVLKDANWRLRRELEEAMVARETSKKDVDYWEDQYDKAVDWAHKLEAERDRLQTLIKDFVNAFDGDGAWMESSPHAGRALHQLRKALKEAGDESST